jgi:hypothetical protein
MKHYKSDRYIKVDNTPGPRIHRCVDCHSMEEKCGTGYTTRCILCAKCGKIKYSLPTKTHNEVVSMVEERKVWTTNRSISEPQNMPGVFRRAPRPV